jgi:hypothetical protein
MKKTLQYYVYYLLVFSMSLFLAFLAYLLTPMFLLGGISFFITAALGLGMGWFIAVFMREIDFLTKHHHAALIIVVFVSSFVFFSLINSDVSSNSLLTGIIFSVSFLIPYVYIHR